MYLVYLSIKSTPYLIAFMLGIFFPVYTFLAHRNILYGLMGILIAYFSTTMAMASLPLMNIGIQVFVEDIFIGVVFFVAVIRLLFSKQFPRRENSWLVFCCVIFLSFGLGLVSYGSTAGVQARQYFYFASTALYAMSFYNNEQQLRHVFNFLAAYGMFLVIVVLARWLIYFLPIPSMLPPGGSFNVDGPIRVVASDNALLMAEIFVLGLFFPSTSNALTAIRRIFIPLSLLMICVLVLQHRSVWLATIMGILTSLLFGSTKKASSAKQLVLLVGMVAILAVPMAMSSKFSNVSDQLSSSAQRALSGSDTTGERLNSWKALLEKWYGGGIKSILIGQSFGADMTRYVQTDNGLRKVNYAAHNMYVQTLMNAGLIGLGSLVVTIFLIVRGLYRLGTHPRNEHALYAKALLSFIAMQLAFYVPYGVNYIQSFVMGLALAYVVSCNKRLAESENQTATTPSEIHYAMRRTNPG